MAQLVTQQIPDSVLSRKVVEKRTSLSRTTIYRKMAEGTFPKNIPLSKGRVGWLESVIQEWIDDLVQSARTDQK